MRGIAAVALLAASIGPARGERPERYDGSPAIDLPAGWKAEPTTDVSAEHAVKLTGADAKKTAIVIAGAKKSSEAELEAEAAVWHAAHLKNRVAWGMRSSGGLPREVLHAGGRKLVRYRDKVGSAIGANEQTLTCAVIAAHLCCVIVQGNSENRDEVDALSLQLLTSLHPRKK